MKLSNLNIEISASDVMALCGRWVRLSLSSLCLLAVVGCGNDIKVEGNLNEEPDIFPDYKEVTIPVNIAPLDFVVNDSAKADYALVIQGKDKEINVKADKGVFDIPQRSWRELLEASADERITFTVCKKNDGKWMAMKPFWVDVKSDKVDKYVAYRLIAPGYVIWRKMGIYQRCVENFDQDPIYENNITSFNCVNCHSFQNRSPEKMVFHMRDRHGGMIYVDKDSVQKINSKTDKTISPLVYAQWHPTANLIAFSTNTTRLAVFTNNINCQEVYDKASDVVIYNPATREIFTSPLLASKSAFETFPSFSPDGKSLYFCSADSISPMPDRYLETHYSLCRIDFDPETCTFGDKVDTLYNAKKNGLSVSFPRVSPDGRFLCFTLHPYGNFSIWQKGSDLYMIDLQDKATEENKTWEWKPMTEVNTNETESYHTWSTNNRWMVFSSRRMDGVYTRLYFTYIDEQGHAHKPFMLPQKNPLQFYELLLYSYNLPEFVTDKVKFNRYDIAKQARDTEAGNVKFKE